MNGRRWSVLSSKGQLSTARLLPRASICVWSAVWVGSSAESAMANLEPNRSGSANNVSMTSSWHTYSSSHNFVRPPSPAPILTGQAKRRGGGLRPSLTSTMENLLLHLNQLANAAAAKLQKLVQSASAEGKPLGCSLNLNKLVSVGHDNIEINVGRRILGVIQVQHGNSIDNAHADGRNVGA